MRIKSLQNLFQRNIMSLRAQKAAKAVLFTGRIRTYVWKTERNAGAEGGAKT